MKELDKRECPMLLLVVMIVFSQNVYAFSQLAVGYWALARDMVQIAVLFFLVVMIFRKNKIPRNIIIPYVVLMGTMVIGMVVNMDFAGSYWLLECTISFLFVALYDEFSIAVKFEKILFIVCLIYMILYIITRLNWNILNTSIYSFLEQYHLVWHHSSLQMYYVNNVVPLRSYAFFREPGVYQMFLILALVVELFVIEKVRFSHVGIYIVAVLMTHSTTGYICLALLMIIWCIKRRKITRKVVFCMAGGVVCCILYGGTFLNSIIAKFTAVGGSSHSWLSRKASVLTNLYMWIQKPLTGVGISYIYANYERINREVFGLQAGVYSITDDTNTVLLFFAAYGLVAGSLFLIGTYGWCRRISLNKIQTLLLFLDLIFLYAGEMVNSTCFPYILFFIGMSYWSKPKTGKGAEKQK